MEEVCGRFVVEHRQSQRHLGESRMGQTELCPVGSGEGEKGGEQGGEQDTAARPSKVQCQGKNR